MKKIFLALAMLPLLSIGQNRFGIALGGSYGKTSSFSVGFTSQRVAGPIGFNLEYKGSTDYQYKNNTPLTENPYELARLKYSVLAGLNLNIKRFVISANGGTSFIEAPKYKFGITGQTGGSTIKGCFEGLIGYNLVEKEKYVINLRAGYNNQYGGLLNLGFLF